MVTVRPATPAEGGTLAGIAREAYRRYVPRMGREPAPMLADYDAVAASGQAWVAQDRGEVIGFIVLVPLPDYLMVENLAVRPSSQGCGAGSRLLALAGEQARARGLGELFLYTSELMTENIGYYRRRGFTEIDRGEKDGFARVFFARKVGPAGQ